MVDTSNGRECRCKKYWDGPNCSHYTGDCHSLCSGGCNGETAADCEYCAVHASWKGGFCKCDYPWTGESCKARLDGKSGNYKKGDYSNDKYGDGYGYGYGNSTDVPSDKHYYDSKYDGGSLGKKDGGYYGE
jgi:hypothetical protein